MKMLLTSGGISNPSLKQALIRLLPKPIEACHAVGISTASFSLTNGLTLAASFYQGKSSTPMVAFPWASFGVLELSVLPLVNKEQWYEQLDKVDVLLINGGDPALLLDVIRSSGLLSYLETHEKVIVGLSAGSMIWTPHLGLDFVDEQHEGGLGWVSFSIFPHLNYPGFTENTLERAKAWAKKMPNDAYAMDDQTGILVNDQHLEVISEGEWYAIPHPHQRKKDSV